MALDNLASLIDSAKKEVADVTTAEGELVTATETLAQANQAAAAAQSAVDSAREKVGTEKTEAISALRAIIAAVNEEISKLQPTS